MAHTAIRRKVQIAARRAQSSAHRCPFCHDSLLLQHALRPCADCGTRYHSECADELRCCSTLGCPGVLYPLEEAEEGWIEILLEGARLLYELVPTWLVTHGVALMMAILGVVVAGSLNGSALGFRIDPQLALTVGCCVGFCLGLGAGQALLRVTNRL